MRFKNDGKHNNKCNGLLFFNTVVYSIVRYGSVRCEDAFGINSKLSRNILKGNSKNYD